jgi:hypothetical protein
MEDEYVPGYVPTKVCPKCQKVKPVTEFYKRGRNAKYLAGYCKACHTKAFDTEKIRCPHCKELIAFFGIDKDKKVIKQKSSILNKLRKEAKESFKKPKKKKVVTEPKSENIKDFLK